MKKLSLVAFAAVVTLTACNGGVSSSTPRTTVQNAARGLAAPDNEQKIGQYIYVWKRVKVGAATQIEVDCPQGYTVLGGGYQGNVDNVDESYPGRGFGSWVVFARDHQGIPETVYATCAPE